MRDNRLYISMVHIFKALVRRPIIPVLLIVVPAVFFLVVYLTTPESVAPFQVASETEKVFIPVNVRNSSLVFFAVAIVGFLASYLALTLIQKNITINRRLIICGYHPVTILMSHLLVLLVLIVLISIYVGLSLLIFFTPSHLFVLITGLILSGWVYGCYGLLVGSLIRGELEGILLIVLLANIDAGWLQNPLFYAQAQNQVIIRYLPAYYPSQTSVLSAFSDYNIGGEIALSILYGLAFFILSVGIYYLKMKKVK